MPNAILDLAVGIEHHLVLRVVHQAYRQRRLQRAPARLVQDAASQPRAQQVQLCLAHRALETEQESVVEIPGAVDAVLIKDQSVCQGTDLQQPMPVRGVAGQARDLQPEHDPDVTYADLANELLEALSVRAGPRLTLV